MTKKTATKVPELEVRTISELCGASFTGCKRRDEYAAFLLEGGSTVRRVLGQVDLQNVRRTFPLIGYMGGETGKPKTQERKEVINLH